MAISIRHFVAVAITLELCIQARAKPDVAFHKYVVPTHLTDGWIRTLSTKLAVACMLGVQFGREKFVTIQHLPGQLNKYGYKLRTHMHIFLHLALLR